MNEMDQHNGQHQSVLGAVAGLCLLRVVEDPLPVLRHPGVHPGVARQGALPAVAHHSDLGVSGQKLLVNIGKLDTTTHLPFSRVKRGPPESPEQESFPVSPAQI